MFKAEVFVTLKPVVNDPAGLTIRGGLHSLGFASVKDVRAGKYLLVTLDEADEATARSRVEEMARQLLANEVIEDFRIEINRLPEPAMVGSQTLSPLGGGQGGSS